MNTADQHNHDHTDPVHQAIHAHMTHFAQELRLPDNYADSAHIDNDDHNSAPVAVQGYMAQGQSQAQSQQPHRLSAVITPTDEQLSIMRSASAGYHVVVQAGAGAAKTTTSCLVAELCADQGQRVLYTAFNKAIVDDITTSFSLHALSTTTVKTFHSLCFSAATRMPELAPLMEKFRRSNNNSGRHYQRTTNSDIVQLLQHHAPGRFHYTHSTGKKKYFTPVRMVGYAMNAVAEFCTSDTVQVEAQHVRVPPAIVHAADRDRFISTVRTVARVLWDDIICDPTNNVYFSHDYYLKLVSLSDCDILELLGFPEDTLIVFDEAQDARPAMTAIIMRMVNDQQKNYQLLAVGDSSQAIYASFTGAKDALPFIVQGVTQSHRPIAEHTLTITRRFGSELATVPNAVLNILHAPIRLTTDPATSSELHIYTTSAIDSRTRNDPFYSEYDHRADPVSATRVVDDHRTTMTTCVDHDDLAYHAAQNVNVVLTRSNASNIAICAVLLQQGKKVYSTVDQRAIRNAITDVGNIMRGTDWRRNIPELYDIKTPDELRALVSNDDLTDKPAVPATLISLLRLVMKDGGNDIATTLNNLHRDERSADVVVTTIHKAKGKQWDAVFLDDPALIAIPNYWMLYDSSWDAQRMSDDRRERMTKVAHRAGLTLHEYMARTRAKFYIRTFGTAWITAPQDSASYTLSPRAREELMVLYVGLTRAKKTLHISADVLYRLDGLRIWLENIRHAGINDPDVIEQAKKLTYTL